MQTLVTVSPAPELVVIASAHSDQLKMLYLHDLCSIGDDSQLLFNNGERAVQQLNNIYPRDVYNEYSLITTTSPLLRVCVFHSHMSMSLLNWSSLRVDVVCGARDSVSAVAVVRSFPGTCDMVYWNLISLILNRWT